MSAVRFPRRNEHSYSSALRSRSSFLARISLRAATKALGARTRRPQAHPSLACRPEGTRPRGNMPRQHHSRSDPTVRSALGQAPTDKELREMISQVDVDQVRVPACRAAAIPENSTHGTSQCTNTTAQYLVRVRGLQGPTASASCRFGAGAEYSAVRRIVAFRPVAERHNRLLGISAPSHEEHAHDRLCRGNVVRIPDLRSGHVAPHSPASLARCATLGARKVSANLPPAARTWHDVANPAAA